MTSPRRRARSAVALTVGLLAGGLPAAASMGPPAQAEAGTGTTEAPSIPVAGGASRYRVTVRTLRFEDTTRPTAANRSFPARPSRALPTTVYQPVGSKGQRFALFVFAHGLTGEPKAYDALLRAIARRGFVVAAPTFPLTNRRTPGGANALDEANQTGDIRFVIDRLLSPDATTPTVIEPSRIAVGGHSLGAITSIDLMTNSCCYDARVKAVISVAGTTNFFRPGKQFGAPATPILFVHGERDQTIPSSLGYSAYQGAKAPKWFVTVVGGGHSFDLNGIPGSQVRVAPAIGDVMVAFLEARLGGAADPPAGSSGATATTAALKAVTAASPGLFRFEAVAG